MNRTDRMLAIVLELQSKGRQRAEDLAALFETSKRTIYRDIQALSEAGVPLVAIPGQGYSLLEGYFLPPLTFSTDEALMLLLGSDFVAQNFDADYRTIAQSAARKLENVLPEKLLEEVRQRQNRIHFITSQAEESDALRELRRAVIEGRTIQFHYQSRYSDEPNLRQADPYALVNYDGAWYMAAYCHLRHDVRRFRLDRMSELSLTNHSFARPANFSLGADRDDSRQLVIRVLFDNEAARWLKESHYFYLESQEPTLEGLLVTLRVRDERDALGWLLGWGGHVRVLEPEAMRQLLQEEAQRILDQYKNT